MPGNPYEICLGTGAQNKTVGRARAQEDSRVLNQTLQTAAILRRLQDLRRLPVTIKVRVLDTPSSYPHRSHGLPEDVIVTLCRDDYYRDENCLFNLLVARLPLDQWGSAEAISMNNSDNFQTELFPYRFDPNERRPASRVSEVALERCRKVLCEYILEIKNWQEILARGPEPDDIIAPWFNDHWRITLYRTLKLSNSLSS